jgi:hypothetical protein
MRHGGILHANWVLEKDFNTTWGLEIEATQSWNLLVA